MTLATGSWLGPFLVLALTSATAAPAVSVPPPPIPDTAPGRCFAELMTLSGAGEAEVAAYVREHFTQGMQRTTPGDPGIVPFLVDHNKHFHGFDVIRVLSSTADQLTMLVRPRSQPGRWFRYVLKVDAAPPHLVEGLFLMPAAPADIPQTGEALSAEEAVVALAGAVDKAAASGEFSGVVLLARGSEIVLQRAAGEADREHHVRVTPETVFGLASMNKMFTAVAIGRLVEQGRLAWTDPVGKYLHDWLPADRARTITIQQLLTHTAGLGDYLDRIESDPTIRGARPLSAYRSFVRASSEDATAPGEFRYSNTGYVVLGAVIEAITGRDYFEFVRAEVYAPAGMTRTDSWCVDDLVENRAIGYLRPGETGPDGIASPAWRSNVFVKGARGTSAGGGLSTAGDLLRFSRALVEGRIVKPATVDALLAPRVRFPVGGDYGYGFVVHEGKDGKRAFGHSGGFAGVNAEFKVYGNGAWTLVVLSNISGGVGGIAGVWDGIVARMGSQP